MHRRLFIAAAAAAPCRQALALYDPPPAKPFSEAPGTWVGTLTYRDWNKPDKLVTLPCQLIAGLNAPNELALYYRFDDGPNKMVHSYDRWALNEAQHELVWRTLKPAEGDQRYAITDTADGRLAFERVEDEVTVQFEWRVSGREWGLTKTEVKKDGSRVLRNRYELRRVVDDHRSAP